MKFGIFSAGPGCPELKLLKDELGAMAAYSCLTSTTQAPRDAVRYCVILPGCVACDRPELSFGLTSA